MAENLINIHDLRDDQKATLKRRIQEKLQAELIKSIQNSPPEIDIDEFKIVLRPGESASQWDADTAAINVTGNCETCSGICTTCSGV